MARIFYDHKGKHEEHELCVGRPYFLIGRRPGNDIVVDHAGVSRHHCAIFRHDNCFWMANYGPNGSSYNPKEANFSIEHLVDDITQTQTYKSLRARVEREIAASVMAQVSGECAGRMNEQLGADSPTMRPGFSIPRTEVADIDVIRRILENPEMAAEFSREAVRLENGSYIALPSIGYGNDQRLFRIFLA